MWSRISELAVAAIAIFSAFSFSGDNQDRLHRSGERSSWRGADTPRCSEIAVQALAGRQTQADDRIRWAWHPFV